MKWGLPALAVVTVAGFLTQKSFRAETVIAAPADEVWRVLMATDKYTDWNPVFVEANGVLRRGFQASKQSSGPF